VWLRMQSFKYRAHLLVALCKIKEKKEVERGRESGNSDREGKQARPG